MKYKCRTNGGEYTSATCPKCGVGTDRFHAWPKRGSNGTGRFWCRKCGAEGTGVFFCVTFLGMSWADAYRSFGIPPKPTGGGGAMGGYKPGYRHEGTKPQRYPVAESGPRKSQSNLARSGQESVSPCSDRHQPSTLFSRPQTRELTSRQGTDSLLTSSVRQSDSRKEIHLSKSHYHTTCLTDSKSIENSRGGGRGEGGYVGICGSTRTREDPPPLRGSTRFGIFSDQETIDKEYKSKKDCTVFLHGDLREKMLIFHKSLMDNEMKKTHLKKRRGLTPETLQKAMVGIDGSGYTVPFFDGSGDCIGIKVRAYEDDTTPRFRCLPHMKKGATYTIGPRNARTALICEGELDAVLYHQNLPKLLCVAIGGATKTIVDADVEACLRKCELILICPDNDSAGIACAKELMELYPTGIPLLCDEKLGVKSWVDAHLSGLINLSEQFAPYDEMLQAEEKPTSPLATREMTDAIEDIYDKVPKEEEKRPVEHQNRPVEAVPVKQQYLSLVDDMLALIDEEKQRRDGKYPLAGSPLSVIEAK